MERKEIQIFVRRYGDIKNRIFYYRKINLSWNKISRIVGIPASTLKYWSKKIIINK